MFLHCSLAASLLSRICQSCGLMMGSVFGESLDQGAEHGGRMVYVATDGDRPRRLTLPRSPGNARGPGNARHPVHARRPGNAGRAGHDRPGSSSFGKIAPFVAAFALASAAAAWMAGFNPASMVMASVPPAGDSLNFDDRFQPIPTRAPVNLSQRSLVQSWSSELELKLQHARTELAHKLLTPDVSSEQQQTAAVEEPKPVAASTSSIPLPRSR